MTKPYAALYVRVSTDAQREEGYSIEAQKEMLEAYCKSKHISDYSFYVDGGFSGSSVDRPEIQRLISDIKNGNISCVVVYKLDRLSRSQKDTLYLIEDVFNPHGVGFVSLNENMDTSTPIGRAMVGIMSAFAQLERETIRERTRMGMRERVKEGLWPGGGKIPFGYDYDRKRGILVPNEDAQKVKKIYELYLSGYSFLRISRILCLSEHQAQQIMLRKTNTGKIVYNGTEYDGQHKAIIDTETYNRAIELYKKRSRAALTTSRSLLAGLLVCGVCGHKMRYQKWGDKGYKIYCYSQDSSKRHIGGDVRCSNGKVWADEIERIVVGDLFEIASKRVSDEGDTKEDSALTLLKSRKASLEKRLKNLYLLYSDSEEDTILELIKDTRKEMARIDEEIGRIEENERNAVDSVSAAAEIAGLGDAWQYMTHEERQSIIRRAIEKIVITHDRVEIFYSF